MLCRTQPVIFTHSAQSANVIQQKSKSSGETYYRILAPSRPAEPEPQPEAYPACKLVNTARTQAAK